MNRRLLLIPAFAAWAFAAAPALAQRAMAPPSYQQPITATEAPAGATSAPSPAVPSTQAPSTPASLPTIAPPNCKPPEYPGKLALNAEISAFNKDYKAYGDCVRKYVEENKAWIAAVVETNNRAVEEYNKYTTDLQKKIDAAKN